MAPLAHDGRGHPNKVGQMRPVHYVYNIASRPAYLERTQRGTLLETVYLDSCLLKLESQNWDGTVPPMPGHPTRDPEASSRQGCGGRSSQFVHFLSFYILTKKL